MTRLTMSAKVWADSRGAPQGVVWNDAWYYVSDIPTPLDLNRDCCRFG
jgi:hypothetical protein